MRGNPSGKGSIWYHNPETGKEIKLFYGEEIPDGFIKGRTLYPNFPFLGNRLTPEKLKEHRDIMRPYLEERNKRLKRGKYKDG